jgi:hypothetical protein
MISTFENIAGRTVNLAVIEEHAASYEAASASLEELIIALESDLEAVKQKHLRVIKRQAGIVANLEAELNSLVESAPDLFKKPRTITVHGVKVGFSVSKGKVVWDDGDNVVKLIERHFEDQADVLIRTYKEPNKDALRNLPAKDLAKLGCRIEDAGDQVIVKRVAGDVEKLVNKLIEKLVEAMVSEG